MCLAQTSCAYISALEIFSLLHIVWVLISSPFTAAVEFIESQTEGFGRANRERENSEQQRLLLQAAGGTGQTQTSHVQGKSPNFC